MQNTVINPLLLTDGYKTGHHVQYPKGTTLVYSNFTPRSNKYAPNNAKKVVSFGQQYVFKWLHEIFETGFFSRPKDEVVAEIEKEFSLYLGTQYDASHIAALHDLGYLPIEVRSIQEGNRVPIKVPVLTIHNTLPEFYWVTNYLETIISNLLWKPMTSATIAFEYRVLLETWFNKTCDDDQRWFLDYQGHDFSMRGMDALDASISSGLGHLTSFLGSDTLPTIYGARKYYGMDGNTIVCNSVPATEHSVMMSGGKESELETFRRLLTTYPTGILSIVSDTWDLWKVCTEYLPALKEEILARDGKIVIRPDSGDPCEIICGVDNDFFSGKSSKYEKGSPQYKGVVELLWDVFGGTVNKKGYKVLNPKIGTIYGDSITLERANEICDRLALKGFASSNIVFGIGSFTYQYNTRDTFGFAMKATYAEVDGEGRNLIKDPVTDDGTKKSATGLLQVIEDATEGYKLLDKQDSSVLTDNEGSALITIYKDGKFIVEDCLANIRNKVKLEVEAEIERINVLNEIEESL